MTSTPPPSIYFTEAYGRAEATQYPRRSWHALAPHEGWHMPLLIGDDCGPAVDAVSPYGYSGIFANEGLGQADLLDAWCGTRAELRRLGAIAVFLRFAPFLPNMPARLAGLPGLKMRHVSDTILVNCADTATMWGTMKGNCRTAVRKAERSGFSTEIHSIESSDLAPAAPFRRLYEATMTRIGAASRYFFTDEYYDTLLAGLQIRLASVVVRDRCDEPAAASLLLLDDSIVHYHLSGSNPGVGGGVANNLLLWEILKWASAHGYQSVHLGGGTSRRDSLFRFKESFGGTAVPYHVGQAVLQPDAYESVTTLHARSHNVSRAELDHRDHFPAYRTPL